MNTCGAKEKSTSEKASSPRRVAVEDRGASPKQAVRAPSKAFSVRMVEPAVTGGCLKPKFGSDTRFHKEVKRRVESYFTRMGPSRGDNPRMYLKTAVLLLWFGGSYALLVFGAATLWEAVPLAFSFALAWAGIGFGVQHDANHGAYPGGRTINRLMGMTLDILGASSYIWRWKHNIAHHTYTNIDGADNDIDIRPFARLSPNQSRHSIHRFQHLYIWVLYSFLHPQWQVEDISQLARARIAKRPFPRPRGWNLAQLLAGKAIFVTWAFVIPALVHPWWVVVLFYLGTSMVLGVVLSVVFQLAHCVEEAEFPTVKRLSSPWAVHQVHTTVDFAPNNRLLTWYVGGLNFQIEHHLFPHICHIHYPRIAKIVRATCEEFGIRYACHASLLAAISSHWRWLRRMGRSCREETISATGLVG